jgi:5,10-methylenetetrahydromethanopterin reductase
VTADLAATPDSAGAVPADPIALSIASHSGLAPASIGALAAVAEDAGFSAVLVAEGHGDALALVHPVAAATRRARVGTAIANAALRPPVLVAKTAAQLDHAAAGRLVLGLGVANPVMNARFGIAPFPPLQMIEEYVAVVRAVLGGSPAGFQGRLLHAGPVPLDSPPLRPGLPVYLAALGPRMLALAGRIADGVILNLMSAAQAGQATAAVRAAAAAAGRDPAAVEVACVVHCCLSDSDDTAATAARAVVPRYVLHPAATRLFGEVDGAIGPGSAVAGASCSPIDLTVVRDLVLAGDRAGAADQVPQAVADAFVARGDFTAIMLRLAEYRAAGVDLPVLFPMPVDGDWGYEPVIAAVAAAGREWPARR